jgi:hypothetical protein
VRIPKIGSRAGLCCFGGIWGIYADLRRELFEGNLDLDFFWVFFGVPRGGLRRGGTIGVFGGICWIELGEPAYE